jgi:UPF0716 protein FxsA
MSFLLLLLWPIAELFVAIKTAEAIGVLAMLGLLILSVPVGVFALRSQGRAAWRRLSDAVLARRSPAREVLDGALILLGGTLMIVPGFITDAIGLLLLLPPTRIAMRALLVRNLQNRLVVRAAGFTRARQPYDVDSTATDLDPPTLRP